MKLFLVCNMYPFFIKADHLIVVQNSSKFFGTPYSEVYHLSTYIKSKLIGSSF